MATTFDTLPIVRRVLRGVSGSQPLAGTPQRAADAYAAMLAGEWAISDDGPAIPAHDYAPDTPAPGDAYRQTWGYDPQARTERSACGACCYTVRIPADALTGESCAITAISAGLLGDRYLECGALVTILGSASPVPPPFAELIANGETLGPILIPDTTIERVNDRPDTSATLVWEPETAPAAHAYLHICLRVADYLATRGAWHDGGAMLDSSTIAVTFSRDVAEEASASGYPLYWLEPSFNGLSTFSRSPGAVFSIEVPDPLWVNWSSVTWTASDQQLRELLSGVRTPGAVNCHDYINDNEFAFGHSVLPYGCNGWGHAAPSTVDGTIWAGYKLRSYTSGDVTGRLPVQRVAAAIYPVTGVLPLSFGALRAPAVTIGSHLSLRLLAYRVASRPPYETAANSYGVNVTRAVEMCKPYPIPDFLDCERLFGGHGESLAFRPAVGTDNEPSPVYPPSTPTTTSPYTLVPISFLSAWTITDNITAGTQFRLTTPLEVDGYAGLLLLAVPCDYSRGGAPASTDNCYCDWPLSGWSLE